MTDLIQLFISIFTGLGVLAAFMTLKANHETLKANHEWNRRKAALALVSSWSTTTLKHRKAIEKEFPGIFDTDNRGEKQETELEKSRANKIYLSDYGDEDWELRFHIVELLNYFEKLSFSYVHNVGDKEILEQAFKDPMIRWHDILSPYINVVKQRRESNPWEPYTDLISDWKANKPNYRKPTA